MTIKSATEQARSESTIYGQGTGWVVSTYDEQMRLHYTAHEAPWRIARSNLSRWRQERIVELLARAGEVEKARSYIRRLTGLEYGTLWGNCSVSYDDKARASELYEMTQEDI